VLEYARLHIKISVGVKPKLAKSVRTNDILCQVSLEEEIFIPDNLLGPFINKWGAVNEDGSGSFGC